MFIAETQVLLSSATYANLVITPKHMSQYYWKLSFKLLDEVNNYDDIDILLFRCIIVYISYSHKIIVNESTKEIRSLVTEIPHYHRTLKRTH